jgi:hypothetical protein
VAQSPDKVVLTSALVTLASTTAASAMPQSAGGQGEFPHPRLLIGTGITYFGLSILADLAPAVSTPLSVILALTAVTYYGFPILEKQFGLKEK